MELVSIMIPVYNAADFLEACLDSVLTQTYSNLEIIVINDGSTDMSEDIVMRYAQTSSSIRYYKQENQGLGYTRNEGIKLSRGKYLFFLDADDTIPKNAIRFLVEALEESQADYAVGKVVRFNEDRSYIPIRHVDFNLYEKQQLTSLRDHPELLQDSIACNKLWVKDFLVSHQLFFKVGKNYEDLSFTMKAAVLAKKIMVVNKVVYQWRVRDDEDQPSITQQQMTLANTMDRLEALSENRQWLLETHQDMAILHEHDVKGLLDVLRLHVLKYALTPQQDRERWRKAILGYLEQMPKAAVEKLPAKEKLLHHLVITDKFEDLLLLSQVLTHTETQALVTQEDNQLVLRGTQQTYTIQSFLKPVVVIENLSNSNGQVELEGRVWMPKTSKPTQANLYIKKRTTSHMHLLAELELNTEETQATYPFEHQVFSVKVDFKKFNDDETPIIYDLYVDAPLYEKAEPSRVRMSPAVRISDHFVSNKQEFIFYRTAYGNLSLKKRKQQKIKDMLKQLYRKVVK